MVSTFDDRMFSHVDAVLKRTSICFPTHSRTVKKQSWKAETCLETWREKKRTKKKYSGAILNSQLGDSNLKKSRGVICNFRSELEILVYRESRKAFKSRHLSNAGPSCLISSSTGQFGQHLLQGYLEDLVGESRRWCLCLSSHLGSVFQSQGMMNGICVFLCCNS